MEYDYLMYTTNDQRCRSVRLWQYGLLNEVRPPLEHKIIGCARDGDGWGILMHDLSEGLFTEDNPFSQNFVLEFLDRLVRLHARFWNDPRLEDPRLGLNDSVSRLKLFSLKLAQGYQGAQMRNTSKVIIDSWEVLESLVEPDVFQILSSLSENPEPLAAALERYPYTLIHGDYRPDNLAYLEPDQGVVFDWHMASRSLMSVDLVFFIRGLGVRNSIGKAGAIRYYRNKLETYLGFSFDDDTWQAMLDLGHLTDAVLIAAFHAYLSKRDKEPWKAHWEMMMKEHVQSTRNGLRWL